MEYLSILAATAAKNRPKRLVFIDFSKKNRNYLAPEGCNIYMRSGADSTKFLENVDLMLTTGTDESLYSGITVSPLCGSKTSSNLLLSFSRPDVSLCLIVAKGDGFELGECQQGIAVLHQPIQ